MRLDKTGVQGMFWPKQLAQNTVPVARVKNEWKKKYMNVYEERI